MGTPNVGNTMLDVEVLYEDDYILEGNVLNGSWFLRLIKSPIFGDTLLAFHHDWRDTPITTTHNFTGTIARCCLSTYRGSQN